VSFNCLCLFASPCSIALPYAARRTCTASAGHCTDSITRNGKTIQSQTIDPNEELRVIITFVTPPRVAAFQKKHSKGIPFTTLNTLEAAIESDHARFDGDLPRLAAAGATRFKGANSTKGQTTAHFRTAFNGVAFRGPRWLVSQLSGLPYVRVLRKIEL